MSKLATTTDTPTDDLFVEALKQLTGLTDPTLDVLHAYAVSHGRKVSDLVGEAEVIAAGRDIDRRGLDSEIRHLRTVQDVGRYADAQGLDAGAVFARRTRMQQESVR